MRRTSAAIAASATVIALLLAGCGDDTTATEPASTTAAPATKVDAAKAGMFVVSYRNAFPKLAEGRDDAAVADVLNLTCSDIKAGKSEADTVAAVVTYSKNGSTTATEDEAKTIYETVKLMC
ncbi:hypothetical protein [Nocardia rhizosphaerae]|uniref:DUF732 domain-containing protein n=1 Tax=Nocardia rhizosphaerae TaxID=1691571 RepID=A0ABV8LA07_9NOCA